MKKTMRRFFVSGKIRGSLSYLVNLRSVLGTSNMFGVGSYTTYWTEISKADMFSDDDCIYAIESGSGHFYEVSSWSDAASHNFNID